MSQDFSDWRNVKSEFRDDIGDPVQRDSEGWGNNHYVNKTGRNDLVIAKISYDANSIYFYIQTKDKITPRTDPNWMLLYIDSDNNPKTGWLGYDFVINRADVRDGTTTIQQNIGGKYQWKTVATIPYFVKNNELEVAVPRSILGITSLPAEIHFKWADNIQQTGDVSDFTLNGDAAPNDRFYYVAKLLFPTAKPDLSPSIPPAAQPARQLLIPGTRAVIAQDTPVTLRYGAGKLLKGQVVIIKAVGNGVLTVSMFGDDVVIPASAIVY